MTISPILVLEISFFFGVEDVAFYGVDHGF